MSQGKRWIHVPVGKQHGFEVTYNSTCLEQTGQCDRSKAHIDGWKSLINTGETFADLRLVHFHVKNFIAWDSTSKISALNFLRPRSGRWGLFCWDSMGFTPQMPFFNMDKWFHPFNCCLLMKTTDSLRGNRYRLLRVLWHGAMMDDRRSGYIIVSAFLLAWRFGRVHCNFLCVQMVSSKFVVLRISLLYVPIYTILQKRKIKIWV